ncbi:MAG: hypothetical protein AAGH78_05735 [Cyanobacteria bacterium P01_H01_bin.58]
MVAAQTRRFTVDEYRRMSELGILTPTECTELVNGEIIAMVAKGTAHVTATTRTKTLFEIGLHTQAIIRVQDPIQLNDVSEPEPDIVLVPIVGLAMGVLIRPSVREQTYEDIVTADAIETGASGNAPVFNTGPGQNGSR